MKKRIERVRVLPRRQAVARAPVEVERALTPPQPATEERSTIARELLEELRGIRRRIDSAIVILEATSRREEVTADGR